MNIDQLNYIRYAIELESYAQAGELLHVTPQAISKAVAETERLCGRELTVRSGRSVKATPFGLAFARHVRTISEAYDDLCAFAHLKEGPHATRADSRATPRPRDSTTCNACRVPESPKG